jgi:hypothetical protein
MAIYPALHNVLVKRQRLARAAVGCRRLPSGGAPCDAPSVHTRRVSTVATALAVVGPSLSLGLLLAGCPKKKTDAERAAEERAAAEKRVQDSFVLVPYRALKITLRGAGVNDPRLAEQKALFDDLTTLRGGIADRELEAKSIAKLAIDLYRAREAMRKVDEDALPTMWEAFFGGPRPLPYYDAGLEHLAVGALAFVFDVALQRDPVADVLFYEISRARPAPGWPPMIGIVARGVRGLAYLNARYHYAAEEELTAYLSGLETIASDDVFLLLVGARTRAELLAGGHLVRALNRFALDRDDAATADLEAGLKQLQALGVDNELTDWGWALVYARTKRYDDARRSLEKLAASPHLGDADRAEIRACAATLGKWDKGFVPFGKTRAQLVIARALIARGGGLEKIFSSVLGPELGPKVYRPLAVMDRVRAQLGAAPKETVDASKEASRRGLDVVRGKLDALRRKAADGAPVSPSPDGGA